MSSGCGCKEVYRFPHITYPYSSCICSFFAAASLIFVHFYICIIYTVRTWEQSDLIKARQ